MEHKERSSPKPQISPSESLEGIDGLTLLDESCIPSEFDQAQFNQEIQNVTEGIRTGFEDANEKSLKILYRTILLTAKDTPGSVYIDGRCVVKTFVETHYKALHPIMQRCLKESDYTELLRIGENLLLHVLS